MKTLHLLALVLGLLSQPTVQAAGAPWSTPPAVYAGDWHSAALSANGTVRVWGSNGLFQLGTTSASDPQLVPLTMTEFSGVSSMAIAQFRTFAVKRNGTVWTWGGTDAGGQRVLIPTQVEGLAGIVAVAASGSHALAVKSDGTVWAWGRNDYGQLGDGTTTNRDVPVQVSGIDGVVAVATGIVHSLALKSDGTVWAWGWNELGVLGNGSTSMSQATPVQVTGLSNVTSIVASSLHSLALTSMGTVAAWGTNDYGELGDGTVITRTTPVAVPGLTGVTSIATASRHSLAAKNDGTVWAWGANGGGALGDGTTTERHSPVQAQGLGADNPAIAVAASTNNHSLALAADGTVWGWGHNYYGQVGDGTRTHPRLTPTPVDDGFPADGLLPAGWTDTTGSTNAWATTTATRFAGPGGLQSGTAGNSGHSGIRVTTGLRDGNITFRRKISSESGGDWLRVYVDGTLAGEWSGELDWQRISIPVTGGTHEVAWKYEKNGAGTGGSDAAWIDSVSLPLSFTDVPAGHWAFGYVNAMKDAAITTGCGGNNYCPSQTVTREQMAAFIVRAIEGEPGQCRPPNPFADVLLTSVFCKHIRRLQELAITTGCGGGNYCPSQPVDRQQMAAFMIRAIEGEPAACTSQPFNDIPVGHAFCKYIQRMKDLAITSGCGNGNYCPTQAVTRDQMGAFLARAFLGM